MCFANILFLSEVFLFILLRISFPEFLPPPPHHRHKRIFLILQNCHLSVLTSLQLQWLLLHKGRFWLCLWICLFLQVGGGGLLCKLSSFTCPRKVTGFQFVQLFLSIRVGWRIPNSTCYSWNCKSIFNDLSVLFY